MDRREDKCCFFLRIYSATKHHSQMFHKYIRNVVIEECQWKILAQFSTP